MTTAAAPISPPQPFAAKRIALPLAAAVALVLLWQFRRFFLSGFDTLSGDIADSRIETVFMEHWLSALRGYEAWPSPNFFHPWPGVLGFTEAFFLFAFPYGAVRALGGDPYLARELTLVLMRAVACVGAALVLRRILRLPAPVAIFGGALFALQNVWAVHIGHTQFTTYFFAPWIALAVQVACTDERIGRRILAGIVAGGLLGGASLSSFNGTWYMVAFFGLGLLVAWLLARPTVALQPVLRRVWPGALAAALLLAAGLIQFVRLYLPQLRIYRGHDRAAVLSSQVTPHDWFAVGTGNYLWGWLARGWDDAGNIESITSLTPILFATLVIGGACIALRGRALPAPWRIGALICAATGLLWLLLITRFGPVGLWRLVYDFVPGGNALRALGRAQMVLPFAAVPVACVVLAWLARRGLVVVSCLFAALLLGEQANSGYYGPVPLHALFRHSEVALLDSVPAPPPSCRVFYVVRGFERPMFPNPDFITRGYAPAIDAMLLAQRFHVPTSNGVSTWTPPGWGPFRIDDPGYLDGMRAWLRQQGVARGVCELDLEMRNWIEAGNL